MENIIGLKQFRASVEKVAQEVIKGKSFIIVRRSRPLFKVSPTDEDDGLWEPVVDLTKIKKSGLALDELLSRL